MRVYSITDSRPFIDMTTPSRAGQQYKVGQQPLRRSVKQAKPTQRANVTNDVVELYSRGVNELTVLASTVPALQKDMADAVRE